MAVNFGVVSKMNCSQQMDWKYNPVVLASALAQLMRQEIVLRLQGIGKPSQSEKNMDLLLFGVCPTNSFFISKFHSIEAPFCPKRWGFIFDYIIICVTTIC